MIRTARPVWASMVVMVLAAATATAQDASLPSPQRGISGSQAGPGTLREQVDAELRRITELEKALQESRAALERLSTQIGTVAAVETEAATPTTAATSPVPAASTPERPRFDFYADTLVRLATLHQGYDRCDGCPDRTIGRFRLRFGAEGRMAPGVRAVFGLSAGELNDPNSVYQTFGGNLGRKTATWDRAYLVVRPTRVPWLELQAGKFPYPWLRSSMTFDVDFYPEGASERVFLDVKHVGVLRNLSAQSFQVVVNEQASAPDMLLIGGQAMSTWKVGAVSTRVAFTAVDVKRPDLILRSQIDGSNVGVKNTNAIVVDTSGARYASGFRYANLIVESAIPTRWEAWPITAAMEYHRNTRAVSDRNAAASVRFDAGRQQKTGDWAFSWHTFRVEQDAIVSAMGESDWRTPSNVLQHRIGVIYTAQEHVQALFTWYRGRTLDSSVPGAVLIPGWKAGQTEPYANRLYFDLAYRF